MSGAEQLSLPQRPVLLGVAGCSGSGKTTLAQRTRRAIKAALFPKRQFTALLKASSAKVAAISVI